MMRRENVVIVGASAAGIATAEALRDEDFDGNITLVGEEQHLPYDRPPLSKELLLGQIEPVKTPIVEDSELGALDIDFLLGTRATGLDIGRKQIQIDGNSSIGYDRLVISTGVTARTIPRQSNPDGLLTLRTIEDAIAIRETFQESERLVIIGAGVLGCEIASAAVEAGLHVVCIDGLASPMLRVLGHLASTRLQRLHEKNGVRFRLGVGVSELNIKNNSVCSVQLTDGSVETADAVIVAIGSAPATSWLENSGLELSNGVECDEFCRATDDIYAAGDVANFYNPRFRQRMRIEHRTNALEQGMNVASNIVGQATPYDPVPFFWTDQFDVKIQYYGIADGDAQATVASGDVEENKFHLLYSNRGNVTGVLGWNAAVAARKQAQLIGRPLPEELRNGGIDQG